jgi:hypothetical protein
LTQKGLVDIGVGKGPTGSCPGLHSQQWTYCCPTATERRRIKKKRSTAEACRNPTKSQHDSLRKVAKPSQDIIEQQQKQTHTKAQAEKEEEGAIMGIFDKLTKKPTSPPPSYTQQQYPSTNTANATGNTNPYPANPALNTTSAPTGPNSAGGEMRDKDERALPPGWEK